MSASKKKHNTLLKNHPSTTTSSPGSKFIDDLYDRLPAYPAEADVFTILCEAVSALYYIQIERQLQNFAYLISNQEELALHLANESIKSLPDDIRQLCFLATELNQSGQQKIANWKELLARFPVIELKLIQHENYIYGIVNEVLLRIEKKHELFNIAAPHKININIGIPVNISQLKDSYNAGITSTTENSLPANEKNYARDNDETNANDNHTLENYISKVCRMINIDEKTRPERKLVPFLPSALYPAKGLLDSKGDLLEKTINFMAGEEAIYSKDDIIFNVKQAPDNTENAIYNGLSGAAFMQLCNITINRTAAKEKKLLALYTSADTFNDTEQFGCFEMDCGLLYLEYLFHKNLISWFDISSFNKRLYSIINIIRKKTATVDIVSGMAGILIVCSRMYLLCPCKLYQSAIKFLASSILKETIVVNGNLVTWGRKWTGFAYGNSGVVYALLLANNILNSKEINSTVVKALHYEQQFKTDYGWKGIIGRDTDKDFNSWCYGATGIYMSRMAMLDENYFEGNEISDILHTDIEHYTKTKENREINAHTSLCYGAYGNAIIDPKSYGEYLNIDYSKYKAEENKSLMYGRPGAVYANLFINNGGRKLPELLLLK